MEYSLQIDLAICLNTEYVWTKRTKKSRKHCVFGTFYFLYPNNNLLSKKQYVI